jgi:hypothetical protein
MGGDHDIATVRVRHNILRITNASTAPEIEAVTLIPSYPAGNTCSLVLPFFKLAQ